MARLGTRPALLGQVHANIGDVLQKTGKTAEAMSAYKRSLETLTPLAENHPEVTDYAFHIANVHNNVGNLLVDNGTAVEAMAAYRRALAIREAGRR